MTSVYASKYRSDTWSLFRAQHPAAEKLKSSSCASRSKADITISCLKFFAPSVRLPHVSLNCTKKRSSPLTVGRRKAASLMAGIRVLIPLGYLIATNPLFRSSRHFICLSMYLPACALLFVRCGIRFFGLVFWRCCLIATKVQSIISVSRLRGLQEVALTEGCPAANQSCAVLT